MVSTGANVAYASRQNVEILDVAGGQVQFLRYLKYHHATTACISKACRTAEWELDPQALPTRNTKRDIRPPRHSPAQRTSVSTNKVAVLWRPRSANVAAKSLVLGCAVTPATGDPCQQP
jgi:hypothetical protein